jgi:hypothetical protein
MSPKAATARGLPRGRKIQTNDLRKTEAVSNLFPDWIEPAPCRTAGGRERGRAEGEERIFVWNRHNPLKSRESDE